MLKGNHKTVSQRNGGTQGSIYTEGVIHGCGRRLSGHRTKSGSRTNVCWMKVNNYKKKRHDTALSESHSIIDRSTVSMYPILASVS